MDNSLQKGNHVVPACGFWLLLFIRGSKHFLFPVVVFPEDILLGNYPQVVQLPS